MSDPDIDRRKENLWRSSASRLTPEDDKMVQPHSKVFISYKQENDQHASWVERLAGDLEKSGFQVFLDRWEVRYGDSLTQYMTSKIDQADVFLLVVTQAAIQAIESPRGALSFEFQLATARRIAGDVRLIPVYRSGSATTTYLRDQRYVDFRDDASYRANLRLLIDDLKGKSPRPIRRKRRRPVEIQIEKLSAAETREDAAYWIDTHSSDKDLPHMVRALAESVDPFVRRTLAFRFYKMARTDYGERVFAYHEDKGGYIRSALINALKDSDDDVRAYAAVTLGHLGEPAATSELSSLLDSPSWRIRQNAWESLEKINTPEAIAALKGRSPPPAGVPV